MRRKEQAAIFLSFHFSRSTFCLFLSIFWANFIQFFSTQNYPTKFLFRELKSDRNTSVKYKVHEILFMFFRCKINKSALKR